MMEIDRRSVLAGVFASALLSSVPAVAAERSNTSRILSRLSTATGYAAAALTAIASGVATATHRRLGRRGAMKLQTRLIDVSSAIEQIYVEQRDLIGDLGQFYARWGPEDFEGARRYSTRSRQERLKMKQQHWENVLGVVATMLFGVQRALAVLAQSRVDFGTQREYNRLEAALGQRHALISRLRRTKAPATQQDFRELYVLTQRYGQLHESLRGALEAIDQYIQTLA